MRKIVLIRAFLLSVFVFFGCVSTAMPSERSQVTGTLTYPKSIVLPPDAVVYITLVDVSPRQDTSANIIARQTIKNPGQVPVLLELEYNSAQIRATHTYAIQAHITSKNGLRLINASPYPVITKGNPSIVDVIVKSATCSQAD